MGETVLFDKDSEAKIPLAKTDNEEDKLLVSFVKKDYESRAKIRQPYELKWRLNMEFVQGNQYCDMRSSKNDIMQLPRMYKYQQREVYNHIAPIYETRLAKLGRVSPSLMTRPATGDREDISTSKVCTTLLKGTYKSCDMKSKIKTATAYSELCGTVFYEQQWNSKKGTLQGNLDGEDIYDGEMETDVCSPFEIYPKNNHCVEQQSIVRAKVFHIDEIYEKWGKRVKGRTLNTYNMKNDSTTAGGLGYTASTQLIVKNEVDDSELVIQYYEMPTKKYKNGRFIIIAGDVLLYKGDLPHKCGDGGTRALPFIRQVCLENPGMFWGSSIVERLIPIQRAYNAIKNRKQEYLNRMVIGVITCEEGSVEDDLFDDGISPGMVIKHTRGTQKPEFMNNGGTPYDFAAEEQRLLDDFTTISGVSPFSRQSAPPVGVNSGIAMELVQEQDDTRLSITADNIREPIIKVGKQWLLMFKQYAKTERVLSYPGRNKITQVMYWQASDITTTDVLLETENELSQTPAQRKQFTLDLDSRGLFNDPATGQRSKRGQAKMMEMLNLGENWEDFSDVDDKHIERAQRENFYFEQNRIPKIKIIDDDIIHIDEHLNYALTSDFEEMEEAEPEKAMVMLNHIEEHKQSVQAKMPQPQPQQGMTA